LGRLLFGFWVVAVDPSFIANDHLRKKIWVILNLFFEVATDIQAPVFLVLSQQAGHKFCSHSPHDQIFSQNALT
jgi:hypothetical protein